MLGLIKRTIKNKTVDIMLRLYKSLVRPDVEYCSSVWSPYFKKDKEQIERIQHRFTRLIPSIKHMTYDERLAKLGLWSLEERKNRADLIETFKLVKGMTRVPYKVFFKSTARPGHAVTLTVL